MCRNIKVLANYEPSATEAEITEAATQFVRKISGFRKPSKQNEIAFQNAIDKISNTTNELLQQLIITSSPKNREEEAEKAKKKSIKRFSAIV